jgi:hypothetical protein
MRRLLLATAVIVLAAVPVSAANAQSGNASVTVVHGVPGLTVDVYVNDELTLEDFEPGTITDPLSLPAGEYTIDVREAGAEASADPAITADATLEGGSNVSLVAHLDGESDPVLTPFVNDASAVGGGEARVSVRHTAAAPAVDVLAGGDPIIEGLENPERGDDHHRGGHRPGRGRARRRDRPGSRPTDLELAPGASYAVYAIGSLEDDNLDLLVQQIGGDSAAAPAGDSGLAADAGGLPTALLLALGLLGAAVLIGSATVLARGRDRA